MSLFTFIGRSARRWHQRRAMRVTERAIAGLPSEIRKDIGWPEPARTVVRRELQEMGW